MIIRSNSDSANMIHSMGKIRLSVCLRNTVRIVYRHGEPGLHESPSFKSPTSSLRIWSLFILVGWSGRLCFLDVSNFAILEAFRPLCLRGQQGDPEPRRSRSTFRGGICCICPQIYTRLAKVRLTCNRVVLFDSKTGGVPQCWHSRV